MRHGLALLLLTLGAASPAFAQDDKPARRITVVPPVVPRVTAPAAGASALSTGSSTSQTQAAAVRISPSLARILPTPIGAAPQCRALCAEARYACESQNSDEGDCGTSWTQCVVGCGNSGYRYSSTAPQVFSKIPPP